MSPRTKALPSIKVCQGIPVAVCSRIVDWLQLSIAYNDDGIQSRFR